jgi:DNA mismatch repair ATPase MutL
MNPKAVDVKCHPAKREVRFKSEYEVTNCVRTAVAAALRAGDIMSAGMLTDDFSDSQQREVQKVQEVPHQEETASPMAKPPLPAFAQPSSSVSPPPQMQSRSPQLDKIMRALS